MSLIVRDRHKFNPHMSAFIVGSLRAGFRLGLINKNEPITLEVLGFYCVIPRSLVKCTLVKNEVQKRVRGHILHTKRCAESTFKTIKAEFVYPQRFKPFEQLQLELLDYVHRFNNICFNEIPGYLSPGELRDPSPYQICPPWC